MWKYIHLAVDGWEDAQHCPIIGIIGICPRRKPIRFVFDRSWEAATVIAEQLKKTSYLEGLSKVHGIVSDNATNIQSALSALQSNTRIVQLRCMAHTANLKFSMQKFPQLRRQD